MQISDKLNLARVSGTVRLSQAARELREAGRDIIDLGEGESDFDTPPHIVTAAFEAECAGATRYTNVAGTTELRDAVARYFRVQNGLDVAAEDVIVGTGAKQLIFNALMATLNPGDEVIVPAPYWVSYPDMVAIADGAPVIAPCRTDTGFKLTVDDLAARLTPKTRWLILNSPNNPSGAVYSRKELTALADVLRAHPDVAVMSDDIYQEIVFDDARFATMAQVAPDLAPRTLTVHGVSKSYAMTGWRIGFATGPRDLIAAMTKLQGQSTTNASSVSQAAAFAALEGPQDFLTNWVAAYRRRRDLVVAGLQGVAGLTFAPPEGA
ncbi:MAG: pyridoxal phosphate-dependent aminotransferase, partial [Verrucomicrobia bacterium]|nr:pyridoxal phosphate-dependent aminotransferase [Verrucomicrobiota bacterium]